MKKIALLFFGFCLISPFILQAAGENPAEVKASSVLVVNSNGLQTSPNPFWLDGDQSYSVCFLVFEPPQEFFRNPQGVELILQSADVENAESEDGFAVIAAGRQAARIQGTGRNQSIVLPLDIQNHVSAGPLSLILVPNGTDGVGLLPQAKLKASRSMTKSAGKGLVAEYLFNGNALDSSKGGHDGTIAGPCEFVADRHGKTLSALRIAGDRTAMVTVPHNEDLDPNQMTIAAWIKGEQPRMWARILQKFNYLEKLGYALFYDHTKKTLAFEAYGQDNKRLWLGSQARLTGEWQHVAFTYDGNLGRFYINGQPDSSIKIQMTLKPYEHALSIGNGYDGNEYYPWSGLIDEVRIFDRALSPDEVSDLFEGKTSAAASPGQLQDLRSINSL